MTALAYKGMLPAEKPNTNTTTYPRRLGRYLREVVEGAGRKLFGRPIIREARWAKLEQLQAIKIPS